MPNLKCSCQECNHNKAQCCCLSSINVAGSSVQNSESTVCRDFTEKSSSGQNSSIHNVPKTNLTVGCGVTNCTYCSPDNLCEATSVSICNCNSCGSKSSECGTFKQK